MMNSYFELKHFILSTRYSGYKSTASALAEIIDNSIEAQATLISIAIDKNSTNDYQIVIADNGVGMPPHVLQLALQFGGSTHFESKTGMGRYGMGLPNASVSQARRCEVVSWQHPDQIYFSYLDIDEIASGQKASLDSPIKIYDFDSLPDFPTGTVVVWKKCDRLSFKRMHSLIAHIKTEIGRVFRRFLHDRITILLNGQPILPIDPLFQNMGNNLIGAETYGKTLCFPVRISASKNDKVNPIIQVKFVKLPIEMWTNTLTNQEKHQYGITKQAGVSILRADREIDYGWYFMGKKRKENYDDWWRCEISFEPELDELFGVTHTKQEIHPTESLLQILEPELEFIARKLTREVRDEFLSLKAKESKSFTNLEKKDVYLEPPQRSIIKDDSEILIPLSKLSFTHHNTSANILRGLSYSLSIESSSNISFFNLSFNKFSLNVVLNKEHPFYEKIYLPLMLEKNTNSMNFTNALQIIIFAAARSETLLLTKNEVSYAEKYRAEWSKVLATLLG